MNTGTLAEMLAPDVQWYEAGNPTPYVGREAVIDRVTGATGPRPFGASRAADTSSQVRLHSVVGDDSNLLVAGTARFDRSGRSLAYRFMEHYRLADGVIIERRSVLEAVPDEVSEFFASRDRGAGQTRACNRCGTGRLRWARHPGRRPGRPA
jgi:hypothetical protein